jgi:hypothetical protein
MDTARVGVDTGRRGQERSSNNVLTSADDVQHSARHAFQPGSWGGRVGRVVGSSMTKPASAWPTPITATAAPHAALILAALGRQPDRAPMPRISRLASRRVAPCGRSVRVSGASRTRVVKFASSSTKAQPRRSTAGGREPRHDVGTHDPRRDVHPTPVVARTHRRESPRTRWTCSEKVR